MKIVRDGKEYELTSEELAAANTEFVTNFIYQSTENPIRRSCNIPCDVVGWG